MTLETVLFILYVVLGPLAWAFFGVMLFAGRRKMVLIKTPRTPVTASPPPSVTILVPAKDEGERIRACLESALRQDYPNFDVVAVDDRSTDQTGQVMDELAAAHPGRFKAVHLTAPPPPPWTGKNHALYNAQQHARGEWLMFYDSDVLLEPDALSTCMGIVLRKKFDMLSLLPRLESHTFWEGLVIPLAAGTAGSMWLMALANNNDLPQYAFANGQFILIKRTAYDAINGHVGVRDRLCEDIEIARQLKVRGLRPRVAWGNEVCSVRMYDNFPAIFRGWARIYYAGTVGSPWRMLAAVAFLLVCTFSVLAALVWGAWRLGHPAASLWGHSGAAWLAAGALHAGLVTYFISVAYRWSGNPGRYALLFFPLGGPLLLYILGRALWMCANKKVTWRGVTYSHAMARDPVTGTGSGAALETAATKPGGGDRG